MFSLGKNHEARTNPTLTRENERRRRFLLLLLEETEEEEEKRNTNAKNNNAIVDDDVNTVELQDGVIGARDARLYAQTKRLGRFGNDFGEEKR